MPKRGPNLGTRLVYALITYAFYGERFTSNDVAKLLGITQRMAKVLINSLMEEGYVERIRGGGVPWGLYIVKKVNKEYLPLIKEVIKGLKRGGYLDMMT